MIIEGAIALVLVALGGAVVKKKTSTRPKLNTSLLGFAGAPVAGSNLPGGSGLPGAGSAPSGLPGTGQFGDLVGKYGPSGAVAACVALGGDPVACKTGVDAFLKVGGTGYVSGGQVPYCPTEYVAQGCIPKNVVKWRNPTETQPANTIQIVSIDKSGGVTLLGGKYLPRCG